MAGQTVPLKLSSGSEILKKSENSSVLCSCFRKASKARCMPKFRNSAFCGAFMKGEQSSSAQSTRQQAFAGAPQQASASSLEERLLSDDNCLQQLVAKAALDLKRLGWARIDGIIPVDECVAYENELWEWLSSLGTGIQRNDPNSWQRQAWPPSFRGIINSVEVAHQAFVWRVRKHPRLLKVFEHLWGSEALLSSFDSINALPHTAKPPKQAWLHVDQAPWRHGVCCIQGLVNLVDVSAETTGTLLVKEGSHNAHQRFFQEVSKVPPEEQRKIKDHYQFTPEELSFWDSYESVAVEGKAGSLFLWDSRTVHANTFPSKLQSFRHVVYTCYQPAWMATERDLKLKRRAYDEYLLTTHWPAMNVYLYERDQAIEYYGVESNGKTDYKIQRTRHLVEDTKLLQLAGVEAYEEDAPGNGLVDMSEEELIDLCK